MMQSGPNPYLRTQIMTASPEQLRLMLYDGAIKFAGQARAAMADNRLEESYEGLMRAQKIVLELSTSLKRDTEPELTEKMSALYTFIYRKLVEANIERNTAALDEAIKLLQFERDTWRMLMEKIAASEGGNTPAPTSAQQTAISAYSRSA